MGNICCFSDPCATLYTSINYGGQSVVMQTTGSYYKNLGPTFANDVKSAKVFPGCMLKLYKDISAVGLLQSVPSSIPSFSNMDQETVSVKCDCTGYEEGKFQTRRRHQVSFF